MHSPIAQTGLFGPPNKPAFADLLAPEPLSALMRSTWTWDDRALRRDMSALLVGIDAAPLATDGAPDNARAATLRARVYSSAARFVAEVLGPKLIADTGNPLRANFLEDATEPARFNQEARLAFRQARMEARSYVAACTQEVDHSSEPSWRGLVAADGTYGLAAAMRSYGYALNASEFYASVGMAWQTVHSIAGTSTAAADIADRLLSQSLSATLAVAEQSGGWDPATVRTRAVKHDDGWLLTGVKQFVPTADEAGLLLVIARSTAGPSLFAVERSAQGLAISALKSTDATRPLFEVQLSDTPATLLSVEGAGGRLMTRAMDLATTALAAEQVGLIERAAALLVATSDPDDAVAHEDRLTEITVDHAAATTLWCRALDEDAAASPHASAAAAAAHIGCSAAAMRSAVAAADLLGPSDETDALLLRAQSASLLFGGPALSHERLLERLGI